ncbi:MAG: hypothetical protein HY560_13630, partial [Gemmatimonadetes bacterium]|nr:hypothetical protein [Gemmatimonadota bacterium]
MGKQIDRREFVATGAAAAAALAAPKLSTFPAPAVILPSAARPAVISSNTGNRSTGADGRVCVQKASEMIVGGSDVLDALITGVNIV